jgi:fumarate hydratase class II
MGHDKAAEMYRLSREKEMTPKNTVMSAGIMTKQEFDSLVNPEKFRMLGFKK